MMWMYVAVLIIPATPTIVPIIPANMELPQECPLDEAGSKAITVLGLMLVQAQPASALTLKAEAGEFTRDEIPCQSRVGMSSNKMSLNLSNSPFIASFSN